MEGLNKTQIKIYNYLSQRSKDSIPPSVREIGAAVGLCSTSSVQANLIVLEKAGYIERDPLLKRTIRVVGQSLPVIQVPILGTVTAGLPILATENVEGYLAYSGKTERDKILFALHICGDSMVNAGILNGDIVIAEKTAVAENGDIVVALLQEEATVKRFFMENGHFRLQPENDLYTPIITDEVIILGKIISLVRNY